MFIEPNGDVREGANAIRSLFNAYVMSGFTEDQALDLVKTHILAAGTGNA